MKPVTIRQLQAYYFCLADHLEREVVDLPKLLLDLCRGIADMKERLLDCNQEVPEFCIKDMFVLDAQYGQAIRPVIIVVEGGCFREAHTAEDQKSILLDWDNLEAGNRVTEEEAQMFVLRGVCTRTEIEPYIRSLQPNA